MGDFRGQAVTVGVAESLDPALFGRQGTHRTWPQVPLRLYAVRGKGKKWGVDN